MAPETGPDKCETIPPDLHAKFADLQEVVEQNLKTLVAVGVPIVRIGSKEIPLAPFDKYKFTPEEYFKYVGSLIDTPEDVRTLTNKPFMEWKKQPNETSRDEFTIFANRGGDCDELSWVAKKLLDQLGCKNNHNYKARVIAVEKHAICIFEDTDGKTYVIEQTDPIKEFTDLKKASAIFKNYIESGVTPNPMEAEIKGNVELQFSLDSVTLKRTYRLLGVIGLAKIDDLKKYVPKDWTNFETTEVHLVDDSVTFYKKGILTETRLADETHIFYRENGKPKKIVNPDGTEKIFVDDGTVQENSADKSNIVRRWFDQEGNLTQDETTDGLFRTYEHGIVIQTIDSSGKTTLFENGTIVQENFPDGSVKIYDEKGNLIQEKLPNGVSKWYDENKNKTQEKLPDGTMKHYDLKNSITQITKPNGTIEWYNKKGKLIQTQAPAKKQP